MNLKAIINNRVIVSLAVGLSSALFLFLLFLVGFFSNINTVLTDNLYGGKSASPQIVIIGIDDSSLQEIGRWPWDRTIYSGVLEQLSESKVIGIDISFFEKSNLESDLNFGQAIKESGNVVLNMEFTDDLENPLLPISEIKDSAKDIGYINIPKDKDGVNRRLVLNINSKYKSFSEVIYKEFTNKEFNYSKNNFYINYVGPPESFRTYSFSDVYFKRIPKEEFKDKIVLIGAVASDFHDTHAVPTSNGDAMPGVEVHANAIQTMLLENHLEKQNSIFLFLELLLLSVLLSFLFFRLELKWISIIVPIFIIFYIFLTIIVFSNYNLILNLVYIPLLIIFDYVAAIIYFYIFQKKEKSKAVKAFSKYVSKEVVKEIMESSKEIKLGGDKKEITILFADIRNFTSISESLEPQKVVKLLNIYLSRMSKVILDNQGLIDKYIGDAIMAFWGAPMENKDSAYLACKSALEMKKQLEIVMEELKANNIPSFKIGIGINTGFATVGNIGSEHRLDYTAIGDTVNLASRIESLTKYYGVTIIISENTYNEIKNKFTCRRIDLVKVKGKDKEVYLYELISEKETEANTDNRQFLEQFNKAFDLYISGEFKKAIAGFEKAQKTRKKSDSVSTLLIERNNQLIKEKQKSKDWKGIYLMDHK